MTTRNGLTAATIEPCGNGCRNYMKGLAAKDGVDIIISTQPPIVCGPYGINGFECPHGVTYWIEPSGEQISQWVKDGTP